MLLICIVTNPLHDLGYVHSIVNIGTFAIALGMMLTSICHGYWQSVLAQKVVAGISNGLLCLPSLPIVPQCFPSKRKALALGIVAAGSSLGTFLKNVYLEMPF